jgi:ribosome maturation factor RimP
LEVSSPGLNRIIFTHNQFKKFVGSPLNVTLIHPELGRKIFIGFLRKVGDDNISIEVEGGILEIATENIRKAMVLDHHYIKERPAL